MIEALSSQPTLVLLLIVGPLLATIGCQRSLPQQNIEVRTIPMRLGNTTVDVVEHSADSAGLTYVNLHDDENTSVKAVLEVIRQKGGRLVELQHTGERNITFSLDGTTFTFDPNRMFTEEGRRETLAGDSTAPQEARREVARLADSLLNILNIQTVNMVVAAHNNTEDSQDGNYSALSYTDEGRMAGEVHFVHITDDVDPNDFFFVTERSIYDQIRNGGFNVVMQDNTLATDDGSLSIYCARHGVPYVNVEAQHGHFDYQLKMLIFLNEMVDNGTL